jgi:adenylate cyclase
LFVDLRGFTGVSGWLEPARVRELLDAYYEYSVAIIRRHRGTVMQFVGDEVFAVFGAPVADEAAADEALRCALALQDEIAALDERLDAAGLPTSDFGIGVHRGPVVAAHVGTEDRRQYAVVGETVNIGARLCDSAGPGEIVVSEQAWKSVAPELRRHFFDDGPILLKGVRTPLAVYRAVRASPAPVRAEAATAAGSNGEHLGESFDAPAVSRRISASGRESGAAGGQLPGRD